MTSLSIALTPASLQITNVECNGLEMVVRHHSGSLVSAKQGDDLPDTNSQQVTFAFHFSSHEVLTCALSAPVSGSLCTLSAPVFESHTWNPMPHVCLSLENQAGLENQAAHNVCVRVYLPPVGALWHVASWRTTCQVLSRQFLIWPCVPQHP